MAGIGDTILATPLIHELRANFPHAHIDALVLWAGSKDILDGNPHLNSVLQKNLLKLGRIRSLPFLFGIRKNKYDVSINTHPQSRRDYRMIARIIAAPVRVSHIYECFGSIDQLLVNRTLPQSYDRHSVELNLDILQLLGKKPILGSHQLEVVLSPEDEHWAADFLQEHKLNSLSSLLGIHAGSGGTKNLALKRWPLRNYVELVTRLRQARPDLGILLFGGPDEDKEISEITSANPSPRIVRVHSPNLKRAGALMKRCTAFLSVDTALMHLAAAVKTRAQIVIEAPTLNKTNEPYANPWTIVRNPALGGRNLEYYKYDGAGIKGTQGELVRCMESVTVQAVFDSVLKKLR